MTLDAVNPMPAPSDVPGPLPTDAGDDEALRTLDVRTLPHSGRHEIIFANLDALGPGESFVILNDHDPKPLRYQTEALWPGVYTWDYLEAGPALWRVAITRAA
ncbi:MAG: DUF2249 domain-containing protein [Cellulomonas sp.]